MKRRYRFAAFLAAAVLFLQGPAARAAIEEAPEPSLEAPLQIAAVPNLSSMDLQLDGEAIIPGNMGDSAALADPLQNAGINAPGRALHTITKASLAHALTIEAPENPAVGKGAKNIRPAHGRPAAKRPSRAPGLVGAKAARPGNTQDNPLQQLSQEAKQDAAAAGSGETSAESADAQAGASFDGIPSGTFDPRVKWSLLTTWSKEAIGPSLFKDIEHPDTRQVDAAVFDFTNFRVGDKRIADVLQQLKARSGSRLRVVAGYDQAMHNENSLWPQIKGMADDAHLLSGLRSEPGSVPAPDRQGLMHVKLWIVRRADGTRIVYAGSANASNAALGGLPHNHEIMLRLEIPAAVAQSQVADSFTEAFEQLLSRAKRFEASLGQDGGHRR